MISLPRPTTFLQFDDGTYLLFQRNRWTDWKSRLLRFSQKTLIGSDEIGHVSILVANQGHLRLYSWCYEGLAVVHNPPVMGNCRLLSLGNEITPVALEAILTYADYKVTLPALLTCALPEGRLKTRSIQKCLKLKSIPCTHVPTLVLAHWLYHPNLDVAPPKCLICMSSDQFLEWTNRATNASGLEFVLRHWAPVDLLAKKGRVV